MPEPKGPDPGKEPEPASRPEPLRGVSAQAIQLVSAVIDGEATDAEYEQLRAMLAEDARVRDYYAQMMDVHARLHLDLVRGRLDSISIFPSPQADGATPPDRRSRQRLSRRTRVRLAVAAFAVAAAALIMVSTPRAPDTRPAGDDQLAKSLREESGGRDRRDFRAKEFGAIAVLAESVDAVWGGGNAGLQAGSTLSAEPLRLLGGVAQIEFVSGANVVIEGPAEFELESSMSMICSSGKLRAHVPRQAIGFVVKTPEQRVVDLGTEFAVDVNHRFTEVHVLDGEVRLEDLAPPGADAGRPDRVLRIGQGIARDADGRERSIAAASSSFIGRRQCSEMSLRASENRRVAWEATRRQHSADPDTLLYYSFEGRESWERVLRHEGPGDGDELEGAVVGCRWADGRWPWKHALEFKRNSDRVRLGIPGAYDSVTFTCWIRIDGFDRWLSSILLTDGHELGEAHWQFTETGQLLLGVKTGQKSSEYLSPSVLRLSDIGRWMHLACVYDGPGETVTHFVDGRPVHSQAITKPIQLRFGDAEIGNWTSEGFLDHTVRSLNGRIDELLLFQRPLAAAEIAELYEAGKP